LSSFKSNYSPIKKKKITLDRFLAEIYVQAWPGLKVGHIAP